MVAYFRSQAENQAAEAAQAQVSQETRAGVDPSESVEDRRDRIKSDLARQGLEKRLDDFSRNFLGFQIRCLSAQQIEPFNPIDPTQLNPLVVYNEVFTWDSKSPIQIQRYPAEETRKISPAALKKLGAPFLNQLLPRQINSLTGQQLSVFSKQEIQEAMQIPHGLSEWQKMISRKTVHEIPFLGDNFRGAQDQKLGSFTNQQLTALTAAQIGIQKSPFFAALAR